MLPKSEAEAEINSRSTGGRRVQRIYQPVRNAANIKQSQLDTQIIVRKAIM